MTYRFVGSGARGLGGSGVGVLGCALVLCFALASAPVVVVGQQQHALSEEMASFGAALEAFHFAQQKAPALESLGIHGFSVALVLGDMQGTATADNVPAGAKKALADMRDFLPYKSYKLIDAQWILCCGGAFGPGTTVSGRLRGSSMPGSTDEQEYAFTVTVTAAQGSRLSVRFSLRDAGAAKNLAPKETSPKQGDESASMAQVRQLEQKWAEEIERERRNVDTKITNAAGKSIMDSTFSMEVGETVVIGTSSLKGDKALIALLTAAARPGVIRQQGGVR